MEMDTKFYDMLKRWHLWIGCICVYLIAIWARYRYFDSVEIYSDSLSPYLAATKVIHTGFSDPPNPESDHWLWITALPQVFVAGSLRELFFLRLCISALVAPMGFLIGWKLCRNLQISDAWLIAFLIGLIVSFDVGLIDTFLSSFRGYMAPEWVALSFLCFLYRGQRNWIYGCSILCIPIAGGHHPLALGILFCSLVGIQNKKEFLFVVVILLCGFLGRFLWIWEIIQCDTGGISCIQEIATGSSERISYFDMIQRVWNDRILGELGWFGICCFCGIWLPLFFRRQKSYDLWLYVSIIGIFLLGLSLSTLRPYHLRIVVVPFVALSVINFCQMWRYSYIMIGILWMVQTPKNLIGYGSNRLDIDIHDDVGTVFVNKNTILWLEGTMESEQQCSVSGVILSAYLQGLSVDFLPNKAMGDVFIWDCKNIHYIGNMDDFQDWRHDIDTENLIGSYDWVRAFYSDDDIFLYW